MLGAYVFGKKPVATAHLEYDLIGELKPGVKYTLFAYCSNKIWRNVIIEGVVFDESNRIVMKLNSWFVHIDWKNSFKIK